MLIEVTKNLDDKKYIIDSSVIEKVYEYKRENKRIFDRENKVFIEPKTNFDILTKIHLKPDTRHCHYNEITLLIINESYEYIKELLGEEIKCL